MSITLATLPQATAQQVFDQVKTHMMAQYAKSVGQNSDVCLYRGPDGLKCAAGCLISDEEAETIPEMKGWQVMGMSHLHTHN